MQKILIVDDDPHIREVLRYALDKAGYVIKEAGDGQQALKLYHSENPDLIVLDIKMPEMDGTEVCRKIRQQDSTPIVFLSSKDEEIDRILGLELGGDDYVTKPFSPRELVARVRAVLRRSGESKNTDANSDAARIYRHGELILNEDLFVAHWHSQEIVLTVTEFGLLRTLLTHPGKVFTRDELMNSAYDFNNVVSDRTIDSHIRRVRAKLGAVADDPIETVHGVGYKLGPC
ncbi:MAG TPA: response regulator transcription factor [Acidiferrobacteraceae bacterium]|nr:response regulator transcription factor [Acidiferrobacteraceae bacterium]HEX20069.1 response regulator transcription factor [Acidiferrobacteraceae bacterium]